MFIFLGEGGDVDQHVRTHYSKLFCGIVGMRNLTLV